MAELLLFQQVADNALIALNDPWLTTAVGDTTYLRLDGTNDMSGPLTLYNGADAIESGAYPIQMESGVADGASAVGLVYNNTNTLANDTASLIELRDGSVTKFRFRPSAPGIGGLGETGQLWLNDESIFDSVEFRGVGFLGAYVFTDQPGNTLSLFPNAGTFISNSPTLVFALGASPSLQTHSVRLESTPQATFKPGGSVGGSITHLGDNNGAFANTASGKWARVFINDNGWCALGNNADATFSYDGTDLLVLTARIGSGLLRFNSANNWNAAGAVATPAIGNLPAAATGVFAGWLTVKDNAGTVRYIPSWT